ncbi:MAG: hypothetical protein ACXU9A_26140 [Xanthobacteraceae bacterium]
MPAMACGGGLFQGCSPCGQAYVEPCAQPQVYVQPQAYVAPAPVYSGCNTGCGGWGYGYERLADPVEQYHAAQMRHQYYYVNQGPTFTGPGAFAPYPTYEEAGIDGHRVYRYHTHPHYRGWHYGMAHHHGYRQHVLRRYY